MYSTNQLKKSWLTQSQILKFVYLNYDVGYKRTQHFVIKIKCFSKCSTQRAIVRLNTYWQKDLLIYSMWHIREESLDLFCMAYKGMIT